MIPLTPKDPKYIERFEGVVPLDIYPQKYYPQKYRPDFVKSDVDLHFGISSIPDIDHDKKYEIIAGFKKAKLTDFINFDWLYGGGGVPSLFNKRLVDKMRQLCPNDFIALPVTLTNLSDKTEPYSNNDFYVVNALNTIDALDHDKSVCHFYDDGRLMSVRKVVYKKNPWQGHLIAFCDEMRGMIFHPKLAKELYPSKQFQFLTPEEDSNLRSWETWLKIARQGDHDLRYLNGQKFTLD